MNTGQKSFSKSLDYGAGALVVLVASIGTSALVYSLIIPFDLFSIPAWIFGPLGIYTLIYSFASGKNFTYYFVWGSVMVTIAMISTFYNLINPLAILGILAIAIAIIGIVAYQRSKNEQK